MTAAKNKMTAAREERNSVTKYMREIYFCKKNVGDIVIKVLGFGPSGPNLTEFPPIH